MGKHGLEAPASKLGRAPRSLPRSRKASLVAVPVPYMDLLAFSSSVASNEQLAGIVEVLRRTLRWATELAPVIGEFPIATADGKPTSDFRTAAYRALGFELDLLEIGLAQRRLGLFEMGSPSPETDLNELIASASLLAVKVARRLRALAQAITMEGLAAGKENRQWTWAGAEAMYNTHVISAMPHLTRCGWDELIEGNYMHELDHLMHALIQLALDLLMSPPQRDQQATEVHRRGSAHEEYVYGSRNWCAICGWLDMIAVPTETHRLYHGNIIRSQVEAFPELRDELRRLRFDKPSIGPMN